MSAAVATLFGTARLIVRKKSPYFRAAMLGLVAKEVPGMGTIGVTASSLLMYDPAWIVKFTPDEVAGLLAHEVMHLVQKAGARRGAREHERWNIACDLAINPSLLDMGYTLPGGENRGMFPKDFGWTDGQTADAYYDLLAKKAEGDAKAPQDAPGGEKGTGSPGKSQSAPTGSGAAARGPAAGKCGSCAGNANEGEGTPEEQAADGGRTQSQLDRMVRQVAEAVKEHAKGRGRIPAGLLRMAEDATEPAKVPWRQTLAAMVRTAVAYRPGAVVHRYDGPSRRQAGIGYGVGKPILPRLRQPVPQVAIVADTSGSMSAHDLGVALREARGVLKAVGAEVTFCICDSAVYGVSKVTSVEQMAGLLKGGGGTDFTPAFEALAKQTPRPEIVIAMTDGDGRTPLSQPPGIRVIWALVGRHCVRPPWGQIVEVDD